MSKKITGIGIMSGTSLDGLDMALCEFNTGNPADFDILHAQSVAFDSEWKEKLSQAMKMSGEELAQLHVDFGIFTGRQVWAFLEDCPVRPQFIASHGHTVFHQPEKQLTLQIGSGAHIAAVTGIKTVCDFRAGDVAHGGQGAPLVPIGDKMLFSEYEYCLNLGGIANISMEKNGERIAFDICPANMVLNRQAEVLHMDYDESGKLAAGGVVDNELMEKLNQLDFYKKDPPRSLGKEWVDEIFSPFVDESMHSVPDKLATLCEHIAYQVAKHTSSGGKMLITGGGAHNSYLVSRILTYSEASINIPSKTIVDFKEALIFAYLGFLRLEEKANCLATVTGAARNTVGGAVYLP